MNLPEGLKFRVQFRFEGSGFGVKVWGFRVYSLCYV